MLDEIQTEDPCTAETSSKECKCDQYDCPLGLGLLHRNHNRLDYRQDRRILLDTQLGIDPLTGKLLIYGIGKIVFLPETVTLYLCRRCRCSPVCIGVLGIGQLLLFEIRLGLGKPFVDKIQVGLRFLDLVLCNVFLEKVECRRSHLGRCNGLRHID